MNVLIIAQHHGAFLTLESCKGKFERTIVLVPKSQIDKYAGFPEKEFQNYYKNISAFCKGWAEVYIIQSPQNDPMTAYINLIRELGGDGKWAVLAAGTIFQNFDESKLNGFWAAATVGRLFDGDQRLSMYGMIGQPSINNIVNLQNHFLNIDNIPEDIYTDQQILMGKQRKLSAMTIARQDILIGQAISAVECVRVRTKSLSSAILSFWMDSIKRNHVEQEYLSYPFDEYAKLARKLKKYLPKATYEVILENGAQSARYRDIAELAL